MDGNSLLTPRQVYAKLNGAVPLSSIYHYLNTGQIKGKKPFGRWLVPLSEIERVLDGAKKEAPSAGEGRRRPKCKDRPLTFRYFNPPE